MTLQKKHYLIINNLFYDITNFPIISYASNINRIALHIDISHHIFSHFFP